MARTARHEYPVTRIMDAGTDDPIRVPGMLLNRAQVRTVIRMGDTLWCETCGDHHDWCPDIQAALPAELRRR